MATKYDKAYDALDDNKNLYRSMEAVKRIYGYKDKWHDADAKGDKATKDSVARKAQVYYKILEDSGYSDVANALKNTNNVGAKQIYEDFIKNNYVQATPTTPTTTPANTSTGVTLPESSVSETPVPTTVTGKIDHLYGSQTSDKKYVTGKYDRLEDYIYGNPFEDEEGKSIMSNYQFKGKTASGNAVANGGASNGGNIDSYAAANANRQQLAFTNAGTQAVLDNFNSRINNLRGALSDLGIYLQNQDKGMQTTINLQQTEEQRVFENDETKKNNKVDRGVKISEVTGYVPDSMSYATNPYLNDDGTVINPADTDFSLIKHNAEEALKTETDPAKIADLKQTIKWAEQARLKKTELEEWSKWRNTTTAVAPEQTESARQFDEQTRLSENELNTTKELTLAEIEAQERMNNADNATTLAKTEKEIASAEKLAQVAEDVTWTEALKEYDLSEDAKTFLGLEVYDSWANEDGVDIGDLLKTYKDSYKLTKQDASNILMMFHKGMPEEDYNELKEWIKSQTWYSKDEVSYTPE